MICAGPDCERTLDAEGRVRRRFCSQACVSAYNREQRGAEDEPTPLLPRACICGGLTDRDEDGAEFCIACGREPAEQIARRAA